MFRWILYVGIFDLCPQPDVDQERYDYWVANASDNEITALSTTWSIFGGLDTSTPVALCKSTTNVKVIVHLIRPVGPPTMTPQKDQNDTSPIFRFLGSSTAPHTAQGCCSF